jgi:hypothetical protein
MEVRTPSTHCALLFRLVDFKEDWFEVGNLTVTFELDCIHSLLALISEKRLVYGNGLRLITGLIINLL